MATLQKIRNHGVILLVVVGLAMLAFILGDFLNSGSSFFNRSREYVGEIEGVKIHYTDYEAAKDQLTEVYKIETGRNDFDEDMASQIRNQVWQMMLMDYTLKAQAKKIGMDITAEELSELCIGNNPHQLIRQRRAFYDENGQFNRDNLVRFLHSIDQEAETNEQAENLKQAKDYWMYWENATRLTYMQEKYTNLIQKMITANNIDAKYQAIARDSKVDVQYVLQPYYSMPDSLVKVRSLDVKKLYNKQKPLYKQTPNRSIEYLTFAIIPSAQDTADTRALMESIQNEFYTTDDIALVVNTNSDVMYEGRNYSATTVPAMYKDFAFARNAKAGNVTPLTLDNGVFRMARLVKCGYAMPDSVQLRPVAQEGQEEQEPRWYTEEQLQRNIAEPAFAGKKGDKFTVPMGLGEVTIEITNVAKATPKVQLAIIERAVTPSSKTYSVLYNQAKQFVINNKTDETFRAAAQQAGMRPQPAYGLQKTQDKIAQLKQSRPIVRWAFEAEEGQVSDVFECGDQFVVALLTEVNDGEYRALKDVQPELQLQALNRRKADKMCREMRKATTLEEVAAIAGTEIKNAEGVTLSANRFANEGNEPKVVGRAFSAEPGQVVVINGNQGAYALVAGTKNMEAPEYDAAAEIQQLNMRFAYSLPYQAINLIQEQADVTDNRANFQ